jgi:hypothetical protein
MARVFVMHMGARTGPFKLTALSLCPAISDRCLTVCKKKKLVVVSVLVAKGSPRTFSEVLILWFSWSPDSYEKSAMIGSMKQAVQLSTAAVFNGNRLLPRQSTTRLTRTTKHNGSYSYRRTATTCEPGCVFCARKKTGTPFAPRERVGCPFFYAGAVALRQLARHPEMDACPKSSSDPFCTPTRLDRGQNAAKFYC